MNYFLLFLLTFMAAITTCAQSSTHTVTDGKNITTISTTCIGAHCRSTISSRPAPDPAMGRNYKAWKKQMNIWCADNYGQYGKNLELFPDPISFDLAHCIKDSKLRSWIIDQNYQKHTRGEKPETYHPAMKPKHQSRKQPSL